MDEGGTPWEASTSTTAHQSSSLATKSPQVPSINSNHFYSKPLPPSPFTNSSRKEKTPSKKDDVESYFHTYIFRFLFLAFIFGLSSIFLYLLLAPWIQREISSNQSHFFQNEHPASVNETKIRQTRSLNGEQKVTLASNRTMIDESRKIQTQNSLESDKFEGSRSKDQPVYLHAIGYSERRALPSESFPQSGMVNVNNVMSDRNRHLEDEERELRNERDRLEEKLLGQLDANSIQRMLRTMRRKKLRRKPVLHSTPSEVFGDKDQEFVSYRSRIDDPNVEMDALQPAAMFHPNPNEPAVTVALPDDHKQALPSITRSIDDQFSEFKSLEMRTTTEVPRIEMTTTKQEVDSFSPIELPILESEEHQEKPILEESHDVVGRGFEEPATFERLPETSLDIEPREFGKLIASDETSFETTTSTLPPPQSELYNLSEETTPWPSTEPDGFSTTDQMDMIVPEDLQETLKSIERTPLLRGEQELITVTPEDMERANTRDRFESNPRIMGSVEEIPPEPPLDIEILKGYGQNMVSPAQDIEGDLLKTTASQMMPTLISDDQTEPTTRPMGRTRQPPTMPARFELEPEEDERETDWTPNPMFGIFPNNEDDVDTRRNRAETVTMQPPTAPPTTQLPTSTENNEENLFAAHENDSHEDNKANTFHRSPLRYYRRKHKLPGYKKAMRKLNKHRKPASSSTMASAATWDSSTESLWNSVAHSDGQRKTKLLKKLHAVEALLNQELDRYIDHFNQNRQTVAVKSRENTEMTTEENDEKFVYIARGEPTRVLPKLHKKKRRHGHKKRKRLSRKKKRMYHKNENKREYRRDEHSTTTTTPSSYPILSESDVERQFATGNGPDSFPFEPQGENLKEISVNRVDSNENLLEKRQNSVKSSMEPEKERAKWGGDVTVSEEINLKELPHQAVHRLNDPRKSHRKMKSPPRVKKPGSVEEIATSSSEMKSKENTEKLSETRSADIDSTTRKSSSDEILEDSSLTTLSPSNNHRLKSSTRHVRRLYYRPLAVRRIRVQPVSSYFVGKRRDTFTASDFA
ncbi:unnamed protein product, partial [Mesorhabditis belari]|uniref:Uncharacterized protein n=1 Tax=Mesorhabditis belari TaxID=2138241 RepID=A0AAF3FPS9_9BILA